MKANFIRAFAVMLMLFLLASCGGPATEPPPVDGITFTAERTSLQAGECTLLHWEVTDGFGVTINDEPVDKAGQMEVCPAETRAYELKVDMGTHIETRQVEIVVSGAGQGTSTEPVTPGIPAYLAESWVRLGGPPGGLGYDIRVNFADPNIWYVTDAHSGFHISYDRGLTWTRSNTGIERMVATIDVPVFSATVDPHKPSTIWVGTQVIGHIYKSTDGGLTWVEMDTGVEPHAGLSFRGFTVDPRSSDIVYAAVEVNADIVQAEGRTDINLAGKGGRVYKTTDGGQTWNLLWQGDALARYVWIDPTNPDILYVSTGFFDRFPLNLPEHFDSINNGGFGVYKSVDGGKTWAALGTEHGLGNLHVSSLYMKPDDPLTLLAGVGQFITGPFILPDGTGGEPGGVYLTTDGGETWQMVLQYEAFAAVEYCEQNPQIAYAASGHAVYRSEDGGFTWQRFSDDERKTWGPPGLYPGVPIDIQIDPQGCDRLFINNYIGGNFLSEDGGQTWRVATTGYSGSSITRVLVDPQDAAHVFAATTMSPFVSEDGGVTWQGIAYGELKGGVLSLALDPSNIQHMLGSPEGMFTSILETDEGGQNWQTRFSWRDNLPADYDERDWIDNKILFPNIRFAPSDPRTVYAVTFHPFIPDSDRTGWKMGLGVYKSTDGGTTWAPANDAATFTMGFSDLVVDPNDAQTVYAVSFFGEGVYKTTDGGANWTAVNQGLPTPVGELLKIAMDPANPQILYIGGMTGLFKSEDGGASWRQLSAGLDPTASIRAMVVDPLHPGVLYIGTDILGVYYSLDGGQTFSALRQGLDEGNLNIVDLALSADGSVLYAAVGLQGVYRLGTPVTQQP